MKIDLVQGTNEWLDWRKGGVGGSDIGTIMGLNPYKNRRVFFVGKGRCKKST